MEEQEPFLRDEVKEFEEDGRKKSSSSSRVFLFGASALNIVVLVVNVFFFSAQYLRHSLPSPTSTCYQHFPNNLSGAVAEYQSTPALFTKFQNSPYTGSPSKETDKAWHDLMESMVIRVTDKELSRTNQTSLPLPNGGYMAWLGVYHELHCIKMLREFKYSSHYHAEMDRGSDEFAHLSVHADHCIEMLRASALCHGDGSLTTFKWSKNSLKPMLDLTRPSHTCVNWEVMTRSVEGRVVTQDEMSQMLNLDLIEKSSGQ